VEVKVTAEAEPRRLAVVLGICDGLTIVLGLLIGLHAQSGAIFHAALSAGIAELVGVGAALWLASVRSLGNFLASAACGIATLLACVLPALPYIFSRGPTALGVSLGLCVMIAGGVTWLRSEKGWLAAGETFGVLFLAALLCYGSSLL
jgi:VIT1/CCC1 family predicted Fe2+/Mn2+ transporter